MWKVAFLVFTAVSAVSSSMVGGFQDADPNDERVKNALNFAVVQHNRASNDMYLSQVAQVVKVQTQVVSGIKYVITANMARSVCRKSEARELCEIPEHAQPYQCTFTVWSRPWLNQVQLLKETCPPTNNV
ncbi:cystatin C (amyloid angiopathy and cerebral hemorrhage) [Takifugu rubripes]|uniref:cystatin C (amyloid angiopathy and cerebral hemorrhage) n=1 Tax=Takifugu rubripes TaxID=31033 RepID=UPI000065EF2A|nr:cystatin-like [Takifugu rubripes]|eukprot:XP_003964277.1 PREDICTED: cystatin-like [Takifugu rubripes]